MMARTQREVCARGLGNIGVPRDLKRAVKTLVLCVRLLRILQKLVRDKRRRTRSQALCKAFHTLHTMGGRCMPLSKLPRPLTSSVRCATHSRTSSKTMRGEGVACVWALDANSPPFPRDSKAPLRDLLLPAIRQATEGRCSAGRLRCC